jgi:hypothetical protein
VRIINTSAVEIRARLIDAERRPAVDGTLRIAPGQTGTFKVGPGSYAVRYRLESSCEVFEGSPVQLVGPRAGVEIALNAIFEQGQSKGARRVNEEL